MEIYQTFFTLASFVFGAVVGSFLNVVILRLPQEQSLNGRSHCMRCGHNLGPLDLVPILSYLFLRAKCRYCKNKISPRYFFVETFCGILFALAFYHIHPADLAGLLGLIKIFSILSILVIVFVIDLEHFLILDSVIFPAAVWLSTLNLFSDILSRTNFLKGNFLEGLLTGVGAALPFFCLWFFSRGRWMGFGDVKLALFLGLALGWPLTGVGIFLAFIIGGLVSFILLIFAKKSLKTHLPLGTFLALGSIFALFYGDQALKWYLSFLGF